MAHISQELHDMIAAPAPSTVIQVIYRTELGIMMCYGTAANTVLEAQANVYAPGCTYVQSLAAGTSIKYENVGTAASPDFNTVALS